MKGVAFVLPFGRSRLVPSGNLTSIVIRASGCAAVGLLCLLSVFQAWSANCVSPPAGLVSWWPAEGNANDIVGTNNGTLYNGVGFAPGMVGQVFVFNGTNSYVEVPDSPSLQLTNDLTIEFWVKRQRLSGIEVIIEKGGDWTGTQCNYEVDLHDSRENYCLYFLYTGGLQGGGSIADYNWHYCAVTAQNGSTNVGIYVDGVLQPISFTAGSTTVVLTPSTRPLHIGAQLDPVTDWYYYSQTYVDEMSLYDRMLSSAEILSIYNVGSAGKCRSPRDATASAILAYDFLVAATITDGGYGYTNTPTVRIIGGGGSGAQAVAVVSNGMVVAVNVLDAGYGYTNMPVILIEPPFIAQPEMGIAAMSLLSFTNLALGTNYQFQSSLGNTWSNLGTAFTATSSTFTQFVSGTADPNDYRLAATPVPSQAYATAQLVNGFVVGATVTSGGFGYVTSPAVTIVGGGGTNATALANISGGVVTSITITDAGIGYTNTPTIQIAPPPPPAAAVSPTVLPVMRVDSANLAPYENYQIQFKPDLGGTWGNWNGGLFSPTGLANSQYLLITNGAGFFRLEYVP
ncbi:MAG: LamG domain-containing protein [Limisphaerales bacterium]